MPCELPVPWPADPVGNWPCKGEKDPWCCPQQISYSKILDMLRESNAAGDGPGWRLDLVSMTAYFDGKNSTGGRVQVWFDDPSTLGVKSRWMRAAGVRGVAMWTANSVDYSRGSGKEAADMWAALRLISRE